GELHRTLAVLARELEMRYGSDHVHPHLHRPAHKVLPAFERHDPLLREGHELERHLVADLLAQLDQRPHRAELWVADVDAAAHELDAVGELPAQHRPDATLHVVDREALDALGPDRDALEKGS